MLAIAYFNGCDEFCTEATVFGVDYVAMSEHVDTNLHSHLRVILAFQRDMGHVSNRLLMSFV